MIAEVAQFIVVLIPAIVMARLEWAAVRRVRSAAPARE